MEHYTGSIDESDDSCMLSDTFSDDPAVADLFSSVSDTDLDFLNEGKDKKNKSVEFRTPNSKHCSPTSTVAARTNVSPHMRGLLINKLSPVVDDQEPSTSKKTTKEFSNLQSSNNTTAVASPLKKAMRTKINQAIKKETKEKQIENYDCAEDGDVQEDEFDDEEKDEYDLDEDDYESMQVFKNAVADEHGDFYVAGTDDIWVENFPQNCKRCPICKDRRFASICEAHECRKSHENNVFCYICFATYSQSPTEDFEASARLHRHYTETHHNKKTDKEFHICCPVCEIPVPYIFVSVHMIADHMFDCIPSSDEEEDDEKDIKLRRSTLTTIRDIDPEDISAAMESAEYDIEEAEFLQKCQGSKF